MQFDLAKRQPALLVLDLQRLFTSADGPFENTGAGDVIDAVNTLVGFCRAQTIPILYSRYLLRDDLADAGLLAANPLVQSGHFCLGSPWMALDERLVHDKDIISLQRSRPGAFWNGQLELALQAQGLDTLLLCGLSVNNAISTTAREAFARDIPTLVVKECTGAAPFEKELALYFDILDTWTAEVVSLDEVCKRLETRPR